MNWRAWSGLRLTQLCVLPRILTNSSVCAWYRSTNLPLPGVGLAAAFAAVEVEIAEQADQLGIVECVPGEWGVDDGQISADRSPPPAQTERPVSAPS